MKTLYIANSCNVLIDLENNTVRSLETQREAISRMYLATEPMHVIYGDGEYNKEVDVKKDDLIITFYDNSFKNRMIVVKNKDWVNNIKDYNKRLQEEKERWASEQIKCDAACESAC